jgi:hypothetical protein
MSKLKTFLLTSLLLTIANTAFAEESNKKQEQYPKMNLNAEYGFLGVIDHKVQFSKNNTYFDYVKDGGQRNTFAVGKFSSDFEFNPQHSLVFLYQPLSLVTNAVLEKDMMQDNVTFTKNTPMKFLYDFPFFRGSYLYDFNDDTFEELAFGGSLQIRNASIEFESLDGSKLVSRRNIGPVPALKFRSKNRLGSNFWYGTEIDGFYAPIRYLNGGTTDVVGAILDANFKIGANLSDKYYPYLNLRYIGGGGDGTSNVRYNEREDGYSNNWLNFVVVTLGVSTSLF